MDIGRAFGAPFKDVRWISKAALGGLWAMLIVTYPAITGFYLEYVRSVAHGTETPLPEWSDFGRLWTRGFLLAIAWFIYGLPAWILLGIGMIPMMSAVSVTDPYSYSGDFAGAFASGTFCVMTFLATAYLIAVSFLAQAAAVNYALSDDFGALFAVGDIWARVRSQSGYATAWIMSIVFIAVLSVASGIAGAILGWIPCIGQLWSLFVGGVAGMLGLLMAGHLFGQWAATAYGLPGLAPAPAGGGGYGPPPVGGAQSGYQPPAPPAPPTPPAYEPPTPPAPPAPPAPPVPPAPPAGPAAPPAPPSPPAEPTAPQAPPAPPEPPASE